ncbi:hypothetical protein AGMMS50249_0400 [candidate division SR1 bacterium]|nr:hypothetical protein AGMMS50249_0400 [candidate division SR1 bacterium]
MLRKYLIQRYVDVSKVEELLGHSSFVYLRGMMLYSVLLFVIYVIYAVIHQQIDDILVQRVTGIIGLTLFVKRVLSFLNLYLDCLLLSADTLTIFLRDGLLQYRTEVLDWSKINSISYNQNSLRDRLCGKGDLVVQLGTNVDFKFQDVSNPKRYVNKILMFKKNYEEHQKKVIEDDLKGDTKNFEVIIDALGEVVKEYLNNNDDMISETIIREESIYMRETDL